MDYAYNFHHQDTWWGLYDSWGIRAGGAVCTRSYVGGGPRYRTSRSVFCRPPGREASPDRLLRGRMAWRDDKQ